nr:PAS domain-containing protein [Paludibacter sp.]
QGVPIYNKNGEIEALEGLMLDISDRKRAEQLLETERTMLRTLIDNIPEKIYSKDLACRKTLANKAEIESLECSSESEIIGKDDFAFFPPEFAQRFQADDKQILKTGIPKLNHEELVIDRKGNSRWMLSSKIPLLDKQQNIIGLIGISRNITLQKKNTKKPLPTSGYYSEQSLTIYPIASIRKMLHFKKRWPTKLRLNSWLLTASSPSSTNYLF